jgi:hypothetical protein
MNEPLDSAERVHYAMLKGDLPRITLMQCAHTWGAQEVEKLRTSNELRADLKNVSDVLIDYDEPSPYQQARAAVAEVQWLKNELMISQKNEYACRQVLVQEQAEIRRLRTTLREARECMNANDPINARDIFGKHEEDDHEDARQKVQGQ